MPEVYTKDGTTVERRDNQDGSVDHLITVTKGPNVIGRCHIQGIIPNTAIEAVLMDRDPPAEEGGEGDEQVDVGWPEPGNGE